MQQIPEEVQKEWLVKEMEGTMDYTEVTRQLVHKYGWEKEALRCEMYEVYSNEFAKRVSYLTSFTQKEKYQYIPEYLRILLEEARDFYWSKLNGIQKNKSDIAANVLCYVLRDYMHEDYDDPTAVDQFSSAINSTKEFFIECLVGYFFEVERLLRAFFYYALRRESNHQFKRVAKRMMGGYANQIAGTLHKGLRIFRVPECGSIGFLQKIKMLMNILNQLGISSSLFRSPDAIYTNDEEYLEEVLEKGYYYLWPQAFGYKPPSDTNIRNLISLDEKTLGILSRIKKYSPKNLPELRKILLEIMLGYPIDPPNFSLEKVLAVYSQRYSENFKGLPLLCLWVYLNPFPVLPFNYPIHGNREDDYWDVESREFLDMYGAWVPRNLNSLISRIGPPCNAEEGSYLTPHKWALKVQEVEEFKGHTHEEEKRLSKVTLRVPLQIHNNIIGTWWAFVFYKRGLKEGYLLYPFKRFEDMQDLIQYDPKIKKLINAKKLTFTFIPNSELPTFCKLHVSQLAQSTHAKESLKRILLGKVTFSDTGSAVYHVSFYSIDLKHQMVYAHNSYEDKEGILNLFRLKEISREAALEYLVRGYTLFDPYPHTDEDYAIALWRTRVTLPMGVRDSHDLRPLLSLAERYPLRTPEEYHEGFMFLSRSNGYSLSGMDSLQRLEATLKHSDMPKFMNFRYKHSSVNTLAIEYLGSKRFESTEEIPLMLNYLDKLSVDEANSYVGWLLPMILPTRAFERFAKWVTFYFTLTPQPPLKQIIKDLKILDSEEVHLESVRQFLGFIYIFLKGQFPDVNVSFMRDKFKYLIKELKKDPDKEITFWGLTFKKNKRVEGGLLAGNTYVGMRGVEENFHDFVYAFEILLKAKPWIRCFAPVYLWHKYTPDIVQFPQHPEDYEYREEWCFVDNPGYFREVYEASKAFFLRDPYDENPALLYTDAKSLMIEECETWEGEYSELDHPEALEKVTPLLDVSHYGIGMVPHYFFLLLTSKFSTRILSEEEDSEDTDIMVDFKAKVISWSLEKARFQINCMEKLEFSESIKDNLVYIIENEGSISFVSWTGKGLEVSEEAIHIKILKKFTGGKWMTYSFLKKEGD